MTFWRLNMPDPATQSVITGDHDLTLCIASVFLAILAARVLLPVTDRYHALQGRSRLLWLAAGSLAMGTGIWAMFFTNILALRLPFAFTLDLPLMALSLVPAVIASGSCIVLFVSAGLSTLRLHQASLLLAFGVGGMHYIGMEALVIPADMYYLPGLFLLSIASAYALSMVGLNTKIMLARHPRLSGYTGNLIGSVILGVAVSSTNFVSMQATVFLWNGDGAVSGNEQVMTNLGLFAAIAGITLLLYGLIVIGSKMDKSLRNMAESLAQSEVRFKRLAESTQAAIFTCNARGITYCNPALSEITGYAHEDILDMPLADSLGAGFADYCSDILATSRNAEKVHYRQFEIVTRDGDPRWLHVSFTRLDLDDEHQCLASACDITEQKQAERSLHDLAYRDGLTGLANRASFMESLEDFLATSKGHAAPDACLVLVDINQFSQINDTFGHQVGDRVLMETAGRLRGFFAHQDAVARFSGDEFAVLFTGSSDRQDLAALAKRLHDGLTADFQLFDHPSDISFSIGITSLAAAHHKTADLVMHETDIALHRAKRNTDTPWVLYDEEIDFAVKRKRRLQTELRQAIHASKLELYYQPIVAAGDHSVRGFEALSRWQRDNGEHVSPGEFIVLAEQSGLIADLELWALDTAMRQIDAWNRQLQHGDFYISVNLSSHTIDDDRLFHCLAENICNLDIRKNQLKLELTERLLVDNSGAITSKLNRLISLGCELMIDDFGTGYSSLSYLHKLPVKVLKVDRSFVVEAGVDANSKAVVDSIINLAKNLNLAVIAEGIETIEQANCLGAMGTDLLQGYLFSRPLTVADASALLEKQLPALAGKVVRHGVLENLKVEKKLVATPLGSAANA